MVIFLMLIVLVAAYLLALRGRTGHKGLPELCRWNYAHRGLHGDGIPENSMAAFKLALWKGYGIELDVHLLKDGGLAVIHDSKLLRTTGAEGIVEDLTTEELTNYHLEGTLQTIPTLQDVLDLFSGQAPLIIELKAENGNYGQLAETVCKAMEHYKGPYCIESFDPRCIQWLKNNRPRIIRGQLASNFLKEKNLKMPLWQRFALSNLLMNFLTRPDFIAYRFEDRNGLAPTLCRKLWKVQDVSWTLRRREDFDTAVAEKMIPIFEGFEV